MKRPFILITLLCPMIFSSCSSTGRKSTISISGAWALYPMAVRWAEEYRKIHPEIRIDISAGGAGKGMADVINGLVDIGMVSRSIYPEELQRGAVPVPVAIDAVVAVVNEKNPEADRILYCGLSLKTCSEIWISGSNKSWGDLLGTSCTYPLHVYTRSDACGAAEVWASLSGEKQEDLLGIGVYGDPGLAQAVLQDSLGIGFNNIGYVYDISTRKPLPGIIAVPLDMDNNGIISTEENFFGTLDQLTDAIAAGRYPSPPSRELYFVFKEKQEGDKILTDFLKWVLTDGQSFVREAGYVPLPEENISSVLKKLE